jgi:hypothetical protein
MNSDVDWYRKHLAEGFVCIESDGSVLNRDQFLSDLAQGPDVADYNLESVNIKVALVRATGIWNRKDGSVSISRFTDFYVQENEEWKAVSAQVTRVSRGPQGHYKRSQMNP